jgi:hypothetical protein
MTLFLTVLAALWTRDFLRAGYRRFMNIRADNKASAEDHCQLANREWERMKSTGDTDRSWVDLHLKMAADYYKSAKWFGLR